MSKIKTTLGKVETLHRELEALLSSKDVKKGITRYQIKKASQETKEHSDAYNDSLTSLREKYKKDFEDATKKKDNDKIASLNSKFEEEFLPIIKQEVSIKLILKEESMMELDSTIPNVCYEFMIPGTGKV